MRNISQIPTISMTTLFGENMQCRLCGHTSSQSMIGSTNSFGAPDLDTRPPEMERSTIDHWIQTCPECGYCAPDISKGNRKFNEIVNCDSYKKDLHDRAHPALANAFLCHSMIQESVGKIKEAAWGCIHAAWVCDDDESEDGAQNCRMKTVTLLQKAKENDPDMLSNPKGSFYALMVDLLRRSGQFGLAMSECEQGLNDQPVEIIQNILKFQKTLIQGEDKGCYTMGDVNDIES